MKEGQPQPVQRQEQNYDCQCNCLVGTEAGSVQIITETVFGDPWTIESIELNPPTVIFPADDTI